MHNNKKNSVYFRRSIYVQLGRQVEQECNKIAKDFRLIVRQNYTVGRGWHLIVNRKSIPKEIPSDFIKVRHTKFNTYFTTEKLGIVSYVYFEGWSTNANHQKYREVYGKITWSFLWILIHDRLLWIGLEKLKIH